VTDQITAPSDPAPPVPSDSAVMKSESISSTIERASSPSVRDHPVASDTMATAGMVRPMLASAEPSARFRLVCMRLRAAARRAANVSGSSTSKAITIPTTAAGADAACTAAPIAGESVFERPTTATSDRKSSARLVSAAALVGTEACSSSARPTGRK